MITFPLCIGMTPRRGLRRAKYVLWWKFRTFNSGQGEVAYLGLAASPNHVDDLTVTWYHSGRQLWKRLLTTGAMP